MPDILPEELFFSEKQRNQSCFGGVTSYDSSKTAPAPPDSGGAPQEEPSQTSYFDLEKSYI
jgi:hypothetical protein